MNKDAIKMIMLTKSFPWLLNDRCKKILGRGGRAVGITFQLFM